MEVDANHPLARLLGSGLALGATDWQLCAGEPVGMRVQGAMQRAPDLGLVSAEAIADLAAAAAGRVSEARDGSFRCRGHLFRFHRFTAFAGRPCLSLRRLADTPPTLAELQAPPAFAAACLASRRGLILISGPTGAGKSTTLAAVIAALNRERAGLILTLEDPIEYRHPPQGCVVRQLEKGADFPSFAEGLHEALRADPDILLVGELRDRETMGAALRAAETGHLVLATLHAASAPGAVARLTGAFEAGSAAEIRAQLSQQLVAVLAQQLVRSRDGRVRAAFELLLATPGVRRLIADPERQVGLLANEISTGHTHGMVSMDQSLASLFRAGTVSRDEALRAAHRPAEFPR